MIVSRYVSYRELHISSHPFNHASIRIHRIARATVCGTPNFWLFTQETSNDNDMYILYLPTWGEHNWFTFLLCNFILILIYYILDQPILYLYWHQTGTTFQCLVHFDSRQFTWPRSSMRPWRKNPRIVLFHTIIPMECIKIIFFFQIRVSEKTSIVSCFYRCGKSCENSVLKYPPRA